MSIGYREAQIEYQKLVQSLGTVGARNNLVQVTANKFNSSQQSTEVLAEIVDRTIENYLTSDDEFLESLLQ